MSTERKRKKPPNRRTFAVAALRRASLGWPPRGEAIKRARVDRGLYKCASCGELVKNKEYQVDHIVPVVSIKQETTSMDEYINALLCDVEGFAILCIPCHDSKTMLEDNMRLIKRNNK